MNEDCQKRKWVKECINIGKFKDGDCLAYERSHKRRITFKGGMGKQFAYEPCPICGKMVSNCGFAYTKHDEACKRQEKKK